MSKLYYESLKQIDNEKIELGRIITSKSCVTCPIFYENKNICDYVYDFNNQRAYIRYSTEILNCEKFIILDEKLENPNTEDLKSFIEAGKSYSDEMSTKDWLKGRLL